MTAGPAHRPGHPRRAPVDGQDHAGAEHGQYAAMKTRKAVVFSMEMSASQLALRLISSVGRVNATRLRTG